MSLSCPCNVQTPSLRRKLVQLFNTDPSPFPDHPVEVGKLGNSQRLSSVVQSRLWAMMQRKLYDGTAAQKLWRQTSTNERLDNDDDEFEDILRAMGEKDAWQAGRQAGRGVRDDLSGDGMLFTDDEADELLLGEENDWNDSDLKRRAIELETDEMLFASEWGGADEDEDMLLLDSDRGGIQEAEDDDRDILLPEAIDVDEMLI